MDYNAFKLVAKLIEDLQYEVALEQLQLEPTAMNSVSLAMVQLSLGNISCADKVISQLRTEELARNRGNGGGLAEIQATTQWLLGRRESAQTILVETTRSLLDGTIRYADPSGGCDWGVLLWFMSTSDENEVNEQISLKFLKNRIKRKQAQGWPGNLAFNVLSRETELETLQKIFGVGNFDEIDPAMQNDMHFRDRLARTLFYFAHLAKMSGDTIRGQTLLVQCAKIKNPHYTVEWYLARQLLGLRFDCRTNS